MHLEEPQLTPACPRNSSDLTPPRVALVTTPPRRPCTHVVLDLEGVLLSLAVGGCVIGMVRIKFLGLLLLIGGIRVVSGSG